MNDPDSHPSHLAYAAGKEFGKKNPNMPSGNVMIVADTWDDSEAFMDGFYEATEE